MNDLLEYLMNYALEAGIGVIYDATLPSDAPSVSYAKSRIIILNGNWARRFESPFVLAHEIGHIVLQHRCSSLAAPTIKIKMEHEADVFATEIIWNYSKLIGVEYNNVYSFMQAFGIPNRMFETVSKLMRAY